MAPKKLDIDFLLSNVKSVHASLSVATQSIDGVMDNAPSTLELLSLINQIEHVIKTNLEDIENIVTDLREAGARDFERCDHLAVAPAEVMQ